MSDAIERLANGKALLAWTIKRAIGVSVPVNECGRAAEAVLSALHLSPDAAAGLADGSWVAVPREPDDAMLIAAGKMLMDNPDASRKQVWDAMISAYDPAAASQQNGEK